MASINLTGRVTGIEESILSSVNRAQSVMGNRKFKIAIDDNASLPLGRITAGAQNFDRALDAATKRVVAFGITAGIFVKIRQGFNEFVSSTLQVQNALTKINANLNLSQKSLDLFGKTVFDAAIRTGRSYTEAADAAEKLSRQNLGVAETSKRLNDSLMLSRFAGMSAAEAVKDITLSLNTFQREGLTSTNIVDRLATTYQKFGISADQVADAIERSGETAQNAGIGFNKLLALITAVEVTTRRGGAAIGSAFNNVFTKLQEPQLQNELPKFGVATRDNQNNPLASDTILSNLAQKYNTLSQSAREYISVQVSGQRQSNILIALLEEINKQNGLVKQSTDATANAQGAAAGLNAKLNQSLLAQLNATKLTFQNLASNVGQQSIGPGGPGGGLGGLFSAISGAKGFLSGETGSSFGKTLGDGLLKGIVNVLTGPGFVLIGATLAKAFAKTVNFIRSDLSSVAGITTESQKREQVQAGINKLLSQATAEERAALAAAKSTLAVKEALARIDNKVYTTQTRQDELSTAVAGSLVSKGILGNPKVNKRFKTLAEGYLPAISNEMSDIGMGVGGASASAQPVVIPNFNFGNGNIGPAVANTDEHIVSTGAGDAIFNKQMVSSYGLPDGAQHLSKGYVPNFARGPIGLTRGASSIGHGAMGNVLRAPGSNFVFKKFNEGEDESYIRQEYAISKYAEEMGLPINKVFGSARRSVKRGGIYKEFVDGQTLGSLFGYRNDPAVEFVRGELEHQFKEKGIYPGDLHSANIMVRKGANKEDYKSLLQHSVVVDPGFFELGDNMKNDPESPRLKKYQKYYHSAARGYIPNMSRGSIPNFALSNLRTSGGQFQSPVNINNLISYAGQAPLGQKGMSGFYGQIQELQRIVESGKLSAQSSKALQDEITRITTQRLVEEKDFESGRLEFEKRRKDAIKTQRSTVAKNLKNSAASLANIGNFDAQGNYVPGSFEALREAQTFRGKVISPDDSIKDATHQKGLEKFRIKREADAIARRDKLQRIGFGASIAAPLIAGFLPEGESGTARGVGFGALSGGINLGSSAAAAGVGPVGIGLAAAGGLLIGALDKWSKGVEEIADKNDKNDQLGGRFAKAIDSNFISGANKQSLFASAFGGVSDQKSIDYTQSLVTKLGAKDSSFKNIKVDSQNLADISNSILKAFGIFGQNIADMKKQAEILRQQGVLTVGPSAFLDASSAQSGIFRQAALLGRQGGGGVPLLNQGQRAEASFEFYDTLGKDLGLNEEAEKTKFGPQFEQARALTQRKRFLENRLLPFLKERNPAGIYTDIRGNPLNQNIEQALTFARQSGNPITSGQGKVLQEAFAGLNQGVKNVGGNPSAGTVGIGGFVNGVKYSVTSGSSLSHFTGSDGIRTAYVSIDPITGKRTLKQMSHNGNLPVQGGSFASTDTISNLRSELNGNNYINRNYKSQFDVNSALAPYVKEQREKDIKSHLANTQKQISDAEPNTTHTIKIVVEDLGGPFIAAAAKSIGSTFSTEILETEAIKIIAQKITPMITENLRKSIASIKSEIAKLKNVPIPPAPIPGAF